MLRFANGYRSTIWAMVEWYHPNCPDGGDWEKKGWWQIEPGQSAVVYGGDHRRVNRWWYYYAHAADGYHWPGDFPETVPVRAFQWCERTADTTSRTIRMRQLDVLGTHDEHILRFR